MPYIRVPLGEHGNITGEHHHLAKRPDALIEAIRRMHEEQGFGYRHIARALDVPSYYARDVINYRIRRNVIKGWKTIEVQDESTT